MLSGQLSTHHIWQDTLEPTQPRVGAEKENLFCFTPSGTWVNYHMNLLNETQGTPGMGRADLKSISQPNLCLGLGFPSMRVLLPDEPHHSLSSAIIEFLPHHPTEKWLSINYGRKVLLLSSVISSSSSVLGKKKPEETKLNQTKPKKEPLFLKSKKLCRVDHILLTREKASWQILFGE